MCFLGMCLCWSLGLELGAMYLGQQFATVCIWVIMIAADNSLFCPLIYLSSGNLSRTIALLLKYEKAQQALI